MEGLISVVLLICISDVFKCDIFAVVNVHTHEKIHTAPFKLWKIITSFLACTLSYGNKSLQGFGTKWLENIGV